MKVKIFLSKDVIMPEYAKPGDSGLDVRSNQITFNLHPGERKLFHTGIYMEIPEGYECQCRPKSGLALNHGITCLNSPGTIDAGYRGECNVILINHGKEPVEIEKGMKIAQFVFQKVEKVEFEQVEQFENLNQSERGVGGFGSTGTN